MVDGGLDYRTSAQSYRPPCFPTSLVNRRVIKYYLTQRCIPDNPFFNVNPYHQGQLLGTMEARLPFSNQYFVYIAPYHYCPWWQTVLLMLCCAAPAGKSVLLQPLLYLFQMGC